MYQDYWKLTEKPFNNTPDTQYFFSSSQHQDALMKLSYVITENIGAGMLTGTYGCGKTVIAHTLMQNLAEGYRFAYIEYPHNTAEDVLRSIVRKMVPEELPEKKDQLLLDPLLQKLREYIEESNNLGYGVVILIDEAHVIKDENVLESLRMLLNFQTEKDFLLTLLLFGQPELAETVGSVEQFQQRIAIHCSVGRLNEKETGDYIHTRLKGAGGENGIFTPDAIDKIYNVSSGIPRLINRVCDLALFQGFANEKEEINADFIAKAVEDFGLKK